MATQKKVLFRLSDKTGYEDSFSDEERREQEETEKMRLGEFLRWTEISEKDPKSNNTLKVRAAIVKDGEGKTYTIPERWIK